MGFWLTPTRKRSSKMNNYGTLILVLFLGLVGFSLFVGRPSHSETVGAVESLEGALLENPPPVRETKAGLENVAVVSHPPKKKRGVSRKPVKKSEPDMPDEKQPDAFDPENFAYYDALLNESPDAFPLLSSVKSGGLVFSLERIAPHEGQYLVRWHLANDGERDFFILDLHVQANRRSVTAKSFMPFSCPPNDSVTGVLLFSRSDVSGKNVWIALKEMADPNRTLQIKRVAFKF